MVKINNQAVIQKLVDELRLYPSKDVIPTELAEKILPVFQINDTAINFIPDGEVKHYRDATLNENDRTIVVPAGKIWQIESFSCYYSATATINSRNINLEIQDSDGNVIFKVERLAIVDAGKFGTLMYYAGAQNNTTAHMDADYNFQFINIAKFNLLAGMKIRIYDASNRDVLDDMITNLMVRELDE